MRCTITIDMGNDAFQSQPMLEVARILRVLAGCIEDGQDVGRLLDINGNTVGSITITEDEA